MNTIPENLRACEPLNLIEPDNTRYALIVTCNGQVLNNTTHDTRRARRDACVEVLRAFCSQEVSGDDIREILDTFGGADPDGALGQISALTAEEGIDIYLEDVPVPEPRMPGVPVALYSVLQSFENSNQNTLRHHRTVEDRTAALRRQLNAIGAAVEPDKQYTDTELAARVESRLNALIDQKVTVHLATSFVPVWAV